MSLSPAPVAGGPLVVPGSGLRPHQREALRDVLDALRVRPRAQVVMACGTGKTRVGIAVAERLGAADTVVLAPSLALLNQLLRIWRAHLPGAWSPIVVCSDTGVRDRTPIDDDLPEPRAEDLGVPVTTDPRALAGLLAATPLAGRAGRGHSARRVVFATYHSLPCLVDAARTAGVTFDLLVADETHHAAGRWDSPFARAVRPDDDPLGLPARHRVYFTATPRTGRRSAEGWVGMDDEDAFGPVAHRLTLRAAIDAGVLCDYQIAVVGVQREEWRRLAWQVRPNDPQVLAAQPGALNPSRLDTPTLAATFALGRAIGELGLRRVVSFHGRVSQAELYARTLPHLAARVPHRPHVARREPVRVRALHVNGGHPVSHRLAALARLRDPGPSTAVVVTNVRCLSEGIDVPALDAIVFANPRTSRISLAQALGRITRRAPGKERGVVVLPVLLPDGMPEAGALERSDFADMWSLMLALREIDEGFAEELAEHARLRGRLSGRSGDLNDSRRATALALPPERVRLLLPFGLPDSFARAFTLRLLTTTTSTWEERFGRLQAWAAEHGHCRIPVRAVVDGVPLGAWVHQQRVAAAAGALGAERTARLAALPGWSWSVWDDNWERSFEALRRWAERHGHANPRPQDTHGRIAIGQWVKTQREQHRKGQLDADRVNRLAALPGWTWSIREDVFHKHLAALRAFAAEHGHSRPPRTYVNPDGLRLGMWVVNRRRREQTCSPWQRQQLESLPGWTWAPPPTSRPASGS
ncbi:DEAD/DEAH box helicase [Streptoalloteichus hindustanus]|uniref:Helicase conserved C-terminal domain-containing protein n=1 Tax=Streptoalloteichus hindustanus TaxID=2017 RepID=A0A1M5N973_STRHI|nr:DEAD/DEAH box helicase [Streptoalloteichus hindustanus]SHG86061.1 Helicase conserved C-terminal domain-containing protein [Streptoalloteichus hindustanus]